MFRNLIKSNKKFIKHNLFSYFVIAFNIIASIYAVKQNLLVLKEELYGLWIIAFSLIGVLGLLNFGFTLIVIFKYNEFQKSNQIKSFFSGNLFVLLSQISLSLVCFVLFYFCSSIIVRDIGFDAIFKDLLITMLPGLIFNVISAYFESVLYYNLKFIYHRNVLEMLRLGVMNLLFVVGLYVWLDVRCLGLIFSGMAFLVCVYSVTKFLKAQKIEIDLKQVNSSYLKSNFMNALSFWIIGFSSFVITQTDVFFISSMKKDLGLVTMYSQSFRLQDIALKFIKKITEIKGPKILSLYNDGNFVAVSDIYRKLLKINLGLALAAFFSIFFLGKIILEYWLEYTIVFDQTLIVTLGLLCITGSIHWVLWNFCNITEQQNKIKNISIIEIVLNLGLSYFLIKEIGLIGLGIASLISNSVTIFFAFRLFRQFAEKSR